jgi:cobyrinic acid a,c-diamide synthase
MDASSQARSAAAVALGFARYDPGLSLAGVVLNRVASPRHEALLREALATLPPLADVPLLGCLPRAETLSLASRHLGLVTAEDASELFLRLEALADWVEQGVDIPALLAGLPELDLPASAPEAAPAAPAVRIGLARDRAFCFLYDENLRLLEAAGAEIVPFSPLADAALPEGLHGLYLPGGYPELSAAALSANAGMLASVRAFCASGRPVWAECGGFMYLQRSLVDAEGAEHTLCGVFPGRAVMRTRRAALGYRQAQTLAPGPLGPAGTLLRGHEFHYSELEQPHADAAAFTLTASDGATTRDGAVIGNGIGNVIGGYFHAHLASNPEAARAFVAACASGPSGHRRKA